MNGKVKILAAAAVLLILITGAVLIAQNQAPPPPTKLVMVVFNKGLAEPSYTHVIDCRYSDKDAVCSHLEKLSPADFRPPQAKNCIIADNIKPRLALVRGLLNGYPLHARFDTSGPCQRKLWNEFSFLWTS